MSIIAVFLALALGIVIGTSALNGAVLDTLKRSIGALTADKRTLEGTIGGLRAQTASDEQLAERIGPAAVAGSLQSRRVVLVTAPNASTGTVEGLLPLLQAAGASVTGTVQLRPDLLDPAKASVVDSVVTRVAPDGVQLVGTDPVQRAAGELAAALVRSSETGGLSSTAAGAVLDGFRQLDLIDVAGSLGSPADLAIVIAGDPVTSPDAAVPAARARALLSFAAALDAAGSGAVVAGPMSSTADGGVLRALRDDGGLSERVSSVDGADRPQGRVAVVLALHEQDGGRAGRYGTGPGNQGPVPSLTR